MENFYNPEIWSPGNSNFKYLPPIEKFRSPAVPLEGGFAILFVLSLLLVKLLF